MIQEAYCSFEISNLLKKKGFDELCIFKYNSEGIKVKAGKAIDEWSNTELEESECSAPTHQMAMAWLREVHNIFIDIRKSLNTYFYGAIIRKDPSNTFSRIAEQYETYEEATEAAIKYALEVLI